MRKQIPSSVHNAYALPQNTRKKWVDKIESLGKFQSKINSQISRFIRFPNKSLKSERNDFEPKVKTFGNKIKIQLNLNSE